ncbi:hypothetical protein B0J12DRAFT_376800 [Macrophomina phaseolina]|uniref:Uncharacterized protein n=1 Tax=Macrophomina phaseolina TaxID=35725 RepID=A0ABQ8GKE9_9PEZI|nr:hypothetical protein B0J12DRAFT_376800 [Macrophomina phaseolina]
MNPTHFLVRRDDDDDAPLTPTMMNLLIALVVLCAVAILSVFALFLLRRARNAKKRAELPMYNEDRSTQRMSSHHRSLTITTAPPYSNNNRSSAVYVYNEKETLMNEQSTSDSPVPEIRITFPEEVDEKGNKQSGRVLVVRVGEHSVGLEPLHEEQLPPYQKDENDRFQSLDLERIGGLKEKTNEKNEYSV